MERGNAAFGFDAGGAAAGCGAVRPLPCTLPETKPFKIDRKKGSR